ncbi:hypothetical protein BO70DRAFT_390519 [Aspergillus heteromorphus CBS 117.55]|uniref:Iron-sulfur cluster assembly factor IBA57 homolog, mitochondrial n=1 Tax=Aspergillus heteromorphus CBS 117.55 TaxID=1448321 RepID=A0A317V2V2_9EURO|nr:uncharacterized protein BO70DRAFT_390519 [Aspergillus heteromorphus CBS 117.55]PWY67167.1 hypothetical protein BO70DRAFT_390519 [Aspergillus heteromorphus CBS 117.55]
MTETKMQLEDWLDDLCVRFIINLPREELESVERICFQVEEAQWFYEDFIRPLDPALPSLSLKAFALRIFQHCPLMSQWSHYHHITAFSEFLAYKTRVPVRGAIMLNHDMDEVVLVKGWKKGANWSFPRGKINKDEKDIDCAIREVYEETGYDVREAGLVQDEADVKFIEITMREQHMRLYVFRGVPQDAHFEPRTRKEISKIEWYKLSELPTLKKSKQQDQGIVAANANKFYMVAPFLHPLKKWIAQQKRLEGKAPGLPKQLALHEGEMSMDEASHAMQSYTPNQAAAEMAGPSDLPEVASTHDASAHLKRLLNINDLVPSLNPAPSVAALPGPGPNALKSNALLELLRSGSRESVPQVPKPEQISPPPPVAGPMPPTNPPYPAPGFFPGFPQQGPHVAHPAGLPPFSQPYHGPTPHLPTSMTSEMPPGPMRQGPPLAAPANPSANLYGMFPPPQLPAGLYRDEALQSRLPSAPRNQATGPAPYQRTGDPQFSHSAQPSQVQGATVPPASKLPPPKLTSHSLALLNVFKDESLKTPKTATATLASQSGAVRTSERKPSQHQDQLLGLLKGSPIPAMSPARKQILQRTRGEYSPVRQPVADRNAAPFTANPRTYTATASGPSANVSQPGPPKSSARKGPNGSSRKPSRNEQSQTLASPITILPRPQSLKKEPSPLPAVSQPSRPSPRSRAAKPRTPEPAKPFQPQILRRSDNPHAIDLLPIRPKIVDTHDQQDAARAVSSPPQAQAQAQSNFDRRPSQTPAQRDMLLSLFGKPAASPSISPAELSSSFQKPSQTSSVVSPLSPLNLHAMPTSGTASNMMRPNPSARTACARCIGHGRSLSTTAQRSAQPANPPPPPAAGYARLTNRGLISITGIDSTTFLQGLITQNMLVTNDPHRATRRTGSYTAFLNSQGRVLNDAFIYPLPQADGTPSEELSWLVEVDKNEVPTLLRHLKKHKLRAKLKLRALDDGERTIWSSWKDHSEPRWAAYNLDSQSFSPFSSSTSTITGCMDTRAPGFGSRLVTPGAEDLKTHLAEEAGEISGSEVDLGSYTVRRILHGVAEGQSEILRESSLPLECNMDMSRGIDFRKGCYVGQELTIRTHHTGVVRKRILPVQLYEESQEAVASADAPVYDPSAALSLPPSGSNISKISARKGRSAGKFLGGVGNIGLALCRLEMMTDIALTGEGTQYSPGQEFKASWTGAEDGGPESGEVRLKALVPAWTREHISSGGVKQNHGRDHEADARRARELLEQLEEEEESRRNE